MKKVNIILAFMGMGACFYHFFIDHLDFSSTSILTCLALMFLLIGVEGIREKERDRKLGFALLTVVLLMVIGLVKPYIEIMF
ncbi:hypothetical protein LCD52_14055 [Rossellomorea vietnamensis]|uniref:hypothetical protein n=1 Tax=Rossellomorea vietnamensis TaxID=218284 RepID=UPI001CCEDCFD|nr:hypothetical protein [Rossellomorea vietnamensis]MCA0149918.1 hypothetical protein [Rossellomorea vietnamensis]